MCLVSDHENVEHQFHVANNKGVSFLNPDLNFHKDVWPKLSCKEAIVLRSKTIVSLMQEEHIEPSEYDVLVVGAQGLDLLVMKGALPILKNFSHIKTEALEFESYTGCSQLGDIGSCLSDHGYNEYSRRKYAEHPEGGSYYDLVHMKQSYLYRPLLLCV